VFVYTLRMIDGELDALNCTMASSMNIRVQKEEKIAKYYR
jgi:hypothetical protein